jgi:hypothetical protein
MLWIEKFRICLIFKFFFFFFWGGVFSDSLYFPYCKRFKQSFSFMALSPETGNVMPDPGKQE